MWPCHRCLLHLLLHEERGRRQQLDHEESQAVRPVVYEEFCDRTTRTENIELDSNNIIPDHRGATEQIVTILVESDSTVMKSTRNDIHAGIYTVVTFVVALTNYV